MGQAAFRAVTTLARQLAEELERVVVMREKLRAVAVPGTPGMTFYPAIAVMTVAINQAKDALGQDDRVASLLALHALESFQ